MKLLDYYKTIMIEPGCYSIASCIFIVKNPTIANQIQGSILWQTNVAVDMVDHERNIYKLRQLFNTEVAQLKWKPYEIT